MVDRQQHFGGTYCPHLPEDGCIRFLKILASAFNMGCKLENRVLFVRICFMFRLFGQNRNTTNSINLEHMGPAGARLSNILDYQTVPILI